MKTLLIFMMLGIIGAACNHTPPHGTDSSHRDSIGDPINPSDTAVDRMDPDSLVDTPKVRF
ncbi:hypothetical protein [Parapedobacter defluvii]|uniref:hypothetical protein n=1 Tax=Parapedobacter defluvii TaxID=2045106 RepID=UPI00166A2BA6|nr:hypothetical protein [Parapedobacter defluvii]